MEYPLGANIASGACKPTHRSAVRSGIQKPVLRHPRSNAGSQKRQDTAHAEVFSRAGTTSPPASAVFFLPNSSRSRHARAKSDFLARRLLTVTYDAQKTSVVAERLDDAALTLGEMEFAPRVAELDATRPSVRRLGKVEGRGLFCG